MADSPTDNEIRMRVVNVLTENLDSHRRHLHDWQHESTHADVRRVSLAIVEALCRIAESAADPEPVPEPASDDMEVADA